MWFVLLEFFWGRLRRGVKEGVREKIQTVKVLVLGCGCEGRICVNFGEKFVDMKSRV